MKHVLFDAANTLIHKPQMWEAWNESLLSEGIELDPKVLKQTHKLTSETISFPDQTGIEFYRAFNSKVLYNLGILPKEELLNKLFLAVHKLDWRPFSDTDELHLLNLPISVASNFNTSLSERLRALFDVQFENVIVSETIGVRKPSSEFYQEVIRVLNIKPSDILYIGDSLELDVAPAKEAGMNAYLVDRENLYPNFADRIQSLRAIRDLLNG